jgi:hypothetical protein
LLGDSSPLAEICYSLKTIGASFLFKNVYFLGAYGDFELSNHFASLVSLLKWLGELLLHSIETHGPSIITDFYLSSRKLVPLSGLAEGIELYTLTTSVIDLKNWTVLFLTEAD